MDKFQYTTNCVNSTANKIHKMIDQARDISYRTFCKYVDWKDASELFGCYALHWKQGLMLKNDWAVSFHKSKYNGKRCVYICHSSIEYIFQ